MLNKQIKKHHVAIMGNKMWMWLGGVICFGKWSVKATVPTACTDGKNVMYGEEFCSKLTEAEMRFVIIHENLHKAARHLQIYKAIYKLDARRANAACDYWINGEAIKIDGGSGFIKLPKGGLYNPKYYGKTVIEIFKDLENKGQGGDGGESQDDPQDGGTNQCPVGTGQTDRNGNEITEGYPKGGNSLDEHDWEGEELTEAEQQALEKDIEIAIRQGRQLAGKMEGNKPRTIDGLLEGKVDYKTELAEFIKEVTAGRDESSWSKLNRRMFHVGHFPSAISNSMGRLAIGVDMSGSVTGRVVSQFMGEIKKLCAEVHPAGLDILWWDTQVCGVQSFEADQLDNIEHVLKPVGGGGTDYECVVDWLVLNKTMNHECVVMLSDGYVSQWVPFPIPAMWVMITDVVAEYGKTVRIDEEDL